MSTSIPGPWKLDCRCNTMIVREPYPHHLPNRPLPEWRAVCQVYGPSPIREANARLIAASPVLLQACKRALNCIEAEYPPRRFSPEEEGTMKDLRAAIARAEESKPSEKPS